MSIIFLKKVNNCSIYHKSQDCSGMDTHGERIADAYGMFDKAMSSTATGAMQSMGKIWWEFAYTAYLGT